MIDFLAKRVIQGKLNIYDVPKNYREAVKERAKELEEDHNEN